MVLAIKKQRNTPSPTAAQLDASDLQRKVALLERDVASLQRMLVEKQNEIDALNKRIRDLERMTPPSNIEAHQAEARRQVLWACIGDDPMLKLDLAFLRRVQAQTQTRLATLDPVTKKDFEAALDRERRNRTPIKFLHLGVHSDQTGVSFADGVATWDWLSERLAGVQVLVLAGCSNDQLADKLRVVDTVVSVRGREIQNNDASQFVEAFWSAVFSPGIQSHSQAFEQALEIAPARVGEFVQLHL
jgi:hypothetical protein